MGYLYYFLVLTSLLELGLSDTEQFSITLADTKCGGKEKASTLLDVAKEFIHKAKNLYPTCVEDADNCGKKEKSFAFLEVATNLISEVKKNYPTCPDTVCPEQHQQAMDCSEVLQSGKNKSGVYNIWPRSRISTKEPLSVYCDMDTDSGGWTVIQRRGNFSNPPDYFFKEWKSYKVGFGNLSEDFWIGNDNIFSISNQAKYKIRFDLEDAEGITGYAQYDQFWIDDEVSNYKLHIKGYSGNVGDAMSRHDTMKFSTKDRDNDAWAGGSCAQDRQGAWWYENCTDAHLNGLYQPGVDHIKGIQWNKWRFDVSLAAVEIKIKPH